MTQAPALLQRLNTWLIWRYEQHPSSTKPRKMPYYATTNRKRGGEQGGNSDRAQLTTYDDALKAAALHKADGVGLAILPSLNVVAVDFDNCIDADGVVRADVLDLVATTYAEISPSGKGLRAFFKGTLDSKKSFTEPFSVEFFGNSGFVTFTGNVLPECSLLGNDDEIADLTPPILELYEQRFGAVGATAPQDDPLMTYEPKLDISIEDMRAALAKCNPAMPEPEWVKVGWAIAHQTDKSEEGRRLWHEWSSGALHADQCAKYDQRACDAKWHYFGRNTGTPITFRSVLKMAKDAAGPLEHAAKRKRFAVIPAMEFAGRTPPTWIIKNVLPQAGLGMVYGESGSGKSFFMLDVAAAIALGLKWRGHLTRQGRVVYIAAEGAGGFIKRVKAYAQFNGVDLNAMGVIGDAPNLLNVDDVKPLIEALKDFGQVDIVIVDTLAQTTPGGNENSAEDMGKALGHCKGIHAATGAMVLLVHHSGKDATKGARGWSGLKAACDVEIELTRVDHDRCATVTKLKDGEDGAQFGFTLQRVDLGKDSDGDEITSCVVRESEVVKRVPIQGEWQAAVWKALNDFAGLTGEGMARDALIAEAMLIADPDEKPDARGRRRGSDKAKRALAELCKKGALYEKEGFVHAN